MAGVEAGGRDMVTEGAGKEAAPQPTMGAGVTEATVEADAGGEAAPGVMCLGTTPLR